MKFAQAMIERVVAGVCLIVMLPILLLVGFLIYEISGDPVIVADDMVAVDITPRRGRYRFRTTGRGAKCFDGVGRFLRRYRLDELPGFWSVFRGDIRLREVLRF